MVYKFQNRRKEALVVAKKVKVTINLGKADAEILSDLALDIMECKDFKKEKDGSLHFILNPKRIKSKTRLDIINALLLGLTKCIEKKTEYQTEEYALLKDVSFVVDQPINVWVNPDALNAMKRYFDN